MESPASAPFAVSPQALAHAFADLSDPPRDGGLLYPLAPILTLTNSSLLAIHRSLLVIAG